MILNCGTPSRFFMIRSTYPLILLAVLYSSEGPHWIVLGFLVVNAIDVLGGLIQYFWKPALVDYRFAVFRDVLYALGFYAAVLQDQHVPALVLAPSTLAELFMLYGYRILYRAVAVEAVLLLIRLTTMHTIYHLIHPSWAIFIVTASVVMGLLGLEITRLEALQASIALQQEQLKETLTEMVTATLAPSGIDETVLSQANISPMLDDICQAADQHKGREIGLRLAHVMALKQNAVNLLTSRELEVLELVSQNQSYRQIADELQVSPGTVRAHVASLMRKADVHDRNELVEWACQNQVLSTMQNRLETASLPAPASQLLHF